MTRTIHIVGLGVAGLSAAVRLAARGETLRLYEGAKVAGGRCRSFHDAKLDCLIDNGNHLLLSGNRSALSYLDLLGARDELAIADTAHFPFVDLKSKERWSVTLSDGLIPWWALRKKTRIPGVKLSEFAPALRLPFTGDNATIAGLTGTDGALYDRFWEPMTWAVLNTTPERASAMLMWNVFRETFAKGGAACRPMIARRGLSETFVDPALTYLAAKGIIPEYNRPLKDLTVVNGRVSTLHFTDESIDLASDDMLLLALPRAAAARFVGENRVPSGDACIVNAHFRLAEPLPRDSTPPLLGLLNAKTHWIFTRSDIVSLTISAADALGLDRISEDELLPDLWSEVTEALGLEGNYTYTAGRLIRERRATFDQSPESVALRPPFQGPHSNMILAGDWVNTKLPATIEGAVRSGELAAQEVRPH
ncbi:MAG: hydroxysqualene dehydroxylase HpnE [Pseudomonadota bacterium]